MDSVLDLVGVEKTYNSGKPNALTVFSNLNLTLRKGEVVGLIAPSGSGKSTLLNLAGLLDTPNSGKVMINGLDLSNARDQARTDARRDTIGFVFQFHHLLAEFSALENVMLPLMASGHSRADARKRATELLTRIGLQDRLDHRPDTLSGGEQQRVAIARALGGRPKLLLADEPTGNLDPDNASLVFELFIDLARSEGLSALVATHNMELAAKMDRVVDLRNL